MALVKFTTNHGDFTLDIDEVNAPVTAANFLQYVREIGRASCRERVCLAV